MEPIDTIASSAVKKLQYLQWQFQNYISLFVEKYFVFKANERALSTTLSVSGFIPSIHLFLESMTMGSYNHIILILFLKENWATTTKSGQGFPETGTADNHSAISGFI